MESARTPDGALTRPGSPGRRWQRAGAIGAFTHFGGVPRTLIGDNARALVVGRDRETGTVIFHPTYLAFCRDCDVQPRACAPYRARTKGKTEAGVKFVKRNGLAEQAFESFAALEAHLAAWMAMADAREHGTTHEALSLRFDRAERHLLRPLPVRALPRREQRLLRRVAHDAFVNVDTVRYSVPHRLVRDHVDVAIDEQVVRIFHGPTLVATHARSREPYARVIDPTHFAGLWRPAGPPVEITTGPLTALGRASSLNDPFASVLFTTGLDACHLHCHVPARRSSRDALFSRELSTCSSPMICRRRTVRMCGGSSAHAPRHRWQPGRERPPRDEGVGGSNRGWGRSRPGCALTGDFQAGEKRRPFRDVVAMSSQKYLRRRTLHIVTNLLAPSDRQPDCFDDEGRTCPGPMSPRRPP